MKKVNYLNQPLGGSPDKILDDPWNVLLRRDLSKSKKIDLFYRIKSNHEAVAGNPVSTDTIECRLIAKHFKIKAQSLWMNCMLYVRDLRNAGCTEIPERERRILEELFKNYGAMLKAGVI